MGASLKATNFWSRLSRGPVSWQSAVSWPSPAGTSSWPQCPEFDAYVPEGVERNHPLKVLLVVAHPDDESECAAVLYRISHELGGIADQVIVTDGAAGHQYSAPARALYRSREEQAWQKNLIRQRREEVARAGQILGIRCQYFLEQPDTGLTLDVQDGLHAWDVRRIGRGLKELLQRNGYDFVFVLSPTAETHGHHQAVALLTLETVAALPAKQRPAVVAVRAQSAAEQEANRDPQELTAFPLLRFLKEDAEWSFDRRTPMACHRALHYSIVVNWVIAEHKSQGMLQMEAVRRTQESFRLFEVSGPDGVKRWNRFVETLSGAAHGAAQEQVEASV